VCRFTSSHPHIFKIIYQMKRNIFHFVTYNCKCSLETARLTVTDLHYFRRFARWNSSPSGCVALRGVGDQLYGSDAEKLRDRQKSYCFL
jgi:hypothetical protein